MQIFIGLGLVISGKLQFSMHDSHAHARTSRDENLGRLLGKSLGIYLHRLNNHIIPMFTEA